MFDFTPDKFELRGSASGDICFYIGNDLYVRVCGDIERTGNYVFIEQYDIDPYTEEEEFCNRIWEHTTMHLSLCYFERDASPTSAMMLKYRRKFGDATINMVRETLDSIASPSEIRDAIRCMARMLISEEGAEDETNNDGMSIDSLLFGK
jgi:hypothetical protein